MRMGRPSAGAISSTGALGPQRTAHAERCFKLAVDGGHPLAAGRIVVAVAAKGSVSGGQLRHRAALQRRQHLAEQLARGAQLLRQHSGCNHEQQQEQQQQQQQQQQGVDWGRQ